MAFGWETLWGIPEVLDLEKENSEFASTKQPRKLREACRRRILTALDPQKSGGVWTHISNPLIKMIYNKPVLRLKGALTLLLVVCLCVLVIRRQAVKKTVQTLREGAADPNPVLK